MVTTQLKYGLLSIAFALVGIQVANAEVPAGTFSGKCVAMAKTNSFVLSQNDSEAELSWVAILDFDAGTYSSISADIDRQSGALSRRTQKDLPIYLFNDEITGIYQLRFRNDQSGTDHIILVPSNGGQTIFFMDPILGSTGVCQKV